MPRSLALREASTIRLGSPVRSTSLMPTAILQLERSAGGGVVDNLDWSFMTG